MKAIYVTLCVLCTFSFAFGDERSESLDAFYEKASITFNFPEQTVTSDCLLHDDQIHYQALFEGTWTPLQILCGMRHESLLIDPNATALPESIHITTLSDRCGLICEEEVVYDSLGQRVAHKVIQYTQHGHSEEMFYYTYADDGTVAEVRKVDLLTGEESFDHPSPIPAPMLSMGQETIHFPLIMTFIFADEEIIEIDAQQYENQEEKWGKIAEKLFEPYASLFGLNPQAERYHELRRHYQCGFRKIIYDGIRKMGNAAFDTAIAFFKEAQDRWDRYWRS